MKIISIFLFNLVPIILCAFSCTALIVTATENHDVEQQGQQQEKEQDFAVVGYLPEWRYEGANYNTLCEHLTHLILFSIEPTSAGGITALDRIPSKDIMEEIHNANNKKKKTKIMICFGGNGRSNGFSKMVQSKKSRTKFITSLVKLCEKYQFHGVDYNWEYPGYVLGYGYQNAKQIHDDYTGLAALINETRVAFTKSTNPETLNTITMAYYPDTKQEQLLVKYGIATTVDLMHSMSYDQNGKGKKHHSSLKYGIKTANQARDTEGMPLHKVTLGVPFYGRYISGSGDWVTYEDIVQKYAPISHDVDKVRDMDRNGKVLAFNGRNTIQNKVKYAQKIGLGGVMIWEAGQDCRIVAVTRHEQTHVVTCPDGKESSLLVAITETIQQKKDEEGTTDNNDEIKLSSQQQNNDQQEHIKDEL